MELKMKFICLALLIMSFAISASEFKLTEVTATTTSTKVLSSDPLRCYVLILNKGEFDVSLKPASAHTGSEGVILVPGGSWEPRIAPKNEMYMKSSESTVPVTVIQGGC
jgi:hypothetical protein